MINVSKKIWTIITHEYLSKVKSKGFIIGTFVAPLAFALIIGASAAFAILGKDSTELKLAIKDNSNLIGQKIVEADTSKYFYTELDENQLKSDLNNSKIDGYVIIDENVLENGKANIFTPGGGGIGYLTSFEKNLEQILRRERLDKFGASEVLKNALNVGIDVRTNKITEKGVEKDDTQALSFVGYFLGFVIYFLMFLYGGLVSRSVVEEKSNRIIEIIASSARPFDILFGKVVGIGTAGLTQVIVWIIIFVALMLLSTPIIGSLVTIDPASLQSGMTMDQATTARVQELQSGIPDISPMLIIGFIFYFLAGYFIYASLFAALGAAVDNEQDAAQLQTPITIPIILPILLIQPIMNNPDAWWATALSQFPLFSPILMIVRIASTNVPAWEIILSVVLLIITFVVSLWFSAKVYRIGILMTGKKPSFKDIIKWLKVS